METVKTINLKTLAIVCDLVVQKFLIFNNQTRQYVGTVAVRSDETPSLVCWTGHVREALQFHVYSKAMELAARIEEAMEQ